MILKTTPQKEYELLDSGNGLKLERYGSYLMKRPDPEALWRRTLDDTHWKAADFVFLRTGNRTTWIANSDVPKSWTIEFGGLVFSIRPTSFKHTGLFPEQLSNWQWIEKVITDYQLRMTNSATKPQVLNLFAYTGGATLASARAGADVCHVDGSKTAVSWARENAKLSDLEESPIRWIVDDVVAFLKKEVKRGRRYDAIIMDPPSFGHGPNDELWKIEEHFLTLMDLCRQVLSDDPLFILINGYTAGYSSIVYQNNLEDMMKGHRGTVEMGELAIQEKDAKRLLPAGIFARWKRLDV
ncbi:MAG: class I SAM-dependent methyltransferase [Patescibacteria group bacterium]